MDRVFLCDSFRSSTSVGSPDFKAFSNVVLTVCTRGDKLCTVSTEHKNGK